MMSQENVEVVRRSNAAFNRGEVDAALKFFAPDAERPDLGGRLGCRRVAPDA